jgi:hypothetical protein
MNIRLRRKISKLVSAITIIIVAILVSTSFNVVSPRFAIANSLPILSNFQHGFSNDVSWDNPDFGGAKSSKIVAGPWALNGWNEGNNKWLSKFKENSNSDKVPYIYMYQVAGKAKSHWGLQDCNVGANPYDTLCVRGADFIRQRSNDISTAYVSVANQIKNNYGTSKPVMLHIEPDIYQFAANTQNNGPITSSQIHTAVNQWTSSIKNVLPNAVLVMDVSPWNTDLAGWSSGFANFDYAGMIGKRFSPNGDGSVQAGVNSKTYLQISQMTGKKLILNDAHGAGGGFLSYDTQWEDRNNVTSRWNNGVVAVLMPPTNNQSLENTIQNYRQNPVPSIVVPPVVISSSSVTPTNTLSSSSNGQLSSALPSSSSPISIISSSVSSSSSTQVQNSILTSQLTVASSSNPAVSSIQSSSKQVTLSSSSPNSTSNSTANSSSPTSSSSLVKVTSSSQSSSSPVATSLSSGSAISSSTNSQSSSNISSTNSTQSSSASTQNSISSSSQSSVIPVQPSPSIQTTKPKTTNTVTFANGQKAEIEMLTPNCNLKQRVLRPRSKPIGLTSTQPRTTN